MLSLLKIFGQSLNTQLVVITIDPRSYRSLIIWKSKSAPFLSMGRYPEQISEMLIALIGLIDDDNGVGG